MSRSRSRKGDEIANVRFRPKLKRRPQKEMSGTYIYAPTMLTKNKDLESKTIVRVTALSHRKDDPIVTVSEGTKLRKSGDAYQVFWEDLRR